MSDRPADPSQWPSSNPSPPGRLPAEPDPTGVRKILSSLPDPGPMPPDLVRRISASLAAEQARREPGWTGRSRGELRGERSVVGSHSLGHSETARVSTVHSDTVASLASAREKRRQGVRRWPLIAAAASVAVLAGAVILGVLGVVNGGTITTASQDAATLSSAGDSSEAGAAAERSEGDDSDEAGSSATEEGADAAAPLDDAATMVSPVPVLSTGAVLTREDLADHVRTVADREDWVPDAVTEQLAAESPINTADGAADCLANAVSEPGHDFTGRIDAIDFVRYDGEPAGLILVLDEPGGPARPLTAYLVPADCGRSTPRLLDEPLVLAS